MAFLSGLMRGKFEKAVPISVMCLNYSTFSKIMEYKRCYKILGIPEDSSPEQIKQAYLNLVKKYHPDSGNPEADPSKFSEIDKAFKILMTKKSKEISEPTVEEQDIKHTAPQHRQYLSFDGVGVGTPFQRQKQYTKTRAFQAAENVMKHRIAKVSAEEGALLSKNPVLKHKTKTKYGFERLVEDLIQESISKGEFSNLSGSGKPLPNHQNRNPYVDFVTHKLNEVLIDNGFTPEWITLHKEIREEITELRSELAKERAYFGPCPLSDEHMSDWNNIVHKYEEMAKDINKRIDNFNLVVPILDKQMMRIDLEKEAAKILCGGEHSKTESPSEQITQKGASETLSVFGLLEDILFKK